MTTLGNVQRTIALHVETTVADIKKGFYPFPNQIEQSQVPCVVVEPRDATIQQDMPGTDQDWNARVRLLILYPRTTDTAQEFNVVNELVEPVVDAFSLGADLRNIHQLIPALSGQVMRINPGNVVYSQQINYGTEYACAMVDLDIKLHRRPGDT